MILLLTNRNLTENSTSTSLGNKLSTNNDQRIRLVKATPNAVIKKIETFEDEFQIDTEINWQLKAVKAGEESSELSSIADELFNDEKPWVFFIHGNNQTAEKNLDKAYWLSETHDVNVLAFSWPSKPPVPFLSDSQRISVLIDILRNPTPFNLASEATKAFIKQKRESYKIARENALESVDDLASALSLAHTHLFNKIPASINILVHSLGNFLFENYINTYTAQTAELSFSNVILHQGDSVYENHSQWANKNNIRFCEQELIITHNRKDSILLLSELDKFIDKAKSNESTVRRMGRGNSDELSSSAKYLDFTGGENVGLQHNFFTLDESSNEYIFQALNILLRGDELAPSLPGFDVNNNYYRIKQAEPEGADFFSESDEF